MDSTDFQIAQRLLTEEYAPTHQSLCEERANIGKAAWQFMGAVIAGRSDLAAGIGLQARERRCSVLEKRLEEVTDRIADLMPAMAQAERRIVLDQLVSRLERLDLIDFNVGRTCGRALRWGARSISCKPAHHVRLAVRPLGRARRNPRRRARRARAPSRSTDDPDPLAAGPLGGLA
jgi:hypothetical protein